MAMKTKAGLIPVHTPEDEKQITRGTLGVQFQHWRKEAGLTLTQVSNALAKQGFRVSISALSLFERGGIDRKGNPVAEARRVKIDLKPEILSELEDLYNVPRTQRDYYKGSYLPKDFSRPLPEGPLLGRGTLTELGRLRAENAILHKQLEQKTKIISTFKRTLDFLQSVLDSEMPLGKGKK